MTNIFNKTLTLALIIGSIVFTALLLVQHAQRAEGSAFTGLPATVATSTLGYAVSASQNILFGTSTCSARVITTRAQPIMLTFTDVQGKVPTAVQGHLQVASTTVVYDSGQYGCDTVRVISATPLTDTISISESR